MPAEGACFFVEHFPPTTSGDVDHLSNLFSTFVFSRLVDLKLGFAECAAFLQLPLIDRSICPLL